MQTSRSLWLSENNS